MKNLKKFLDDEHGAVTTDFVLLGVTVSLLSIFTMFNIANGALFKAQTVADSVGSISTNGSNTNVKVRN